MNYIKNNKVFLFLFLSFSIIILTLSYRIISGNQSNSSGQDINDVEYTNNSIASLNGAFSDARLGIEFSWNIQLATGDTIEKYEIFQDDKLLKSGKNAASCILTLEEHEFTTGNNKFDLLVTFKSGQTLTKSVYVYIDEAYDFKVSQKVEGNKLVYNLSYYYDERRPVTPPQMRVTNSDQPFQVRYISANEVIRKGHYVSMNAEYELSYQGVAAGKYSVDIRWEFSDYNLFFNSNSMIDVEGE